MDVPKGKEQQQPVSHLHKSTLTGLPHEQGDCSWDLLKTWVKLCLLLITTSSSLHHLIHSLLKGAGAWRGGAGRGRGKGRRLSPLLKINYN